MKLLYTTAMVLAVTAGAASAQMAEQDYDVINKDNLRSQSGFIGMGVGQQISRDNTNPSATVAAPVPAYPQEAMVTAPQMTAEEYNMIEAAAGDTPEMPTAPEIPASPQSPDIIWNEAPTPITITAPVTPEADMATMSATTETSAKEMMPEVTAQTPTMPAQQATEMEMVTPSAGVTVLEEETVVEAMPMTQPEEAEQTVVTTHKIIGNTDTGVDPEKVLKAFEAQNN